MIPFDPATSLRGSFREWLMARIVETLQDTIDIIDFWKKPIEVKNLRGNIDEERQVLLAP